MRIAPRLTGPRMAVGAYFAFDGRPFDAHTRATWEWAMSEWDRVVAAAQAVRLVIVGQEYCPVDPSQGPNAAQLSELRSKLAACRAAEQLVFGHVYAGEGKIPMGAPGQRVQDPRSTSPRTVPCMRDQIEAWHSQFGTTIDGIYVDAGPTDCGASIPGNYQAYVTAIKDHGYQVVLQVSRYPDNQPGNPWLQRLDADYLNLWRRGATEYNSEYEALDYCDPHRPGIGVPAWWNADPTQTYSRVHVIDDCADAAQMGKIASRAISDKRGAWTVWITHPRHDEHFGYVYDRLPEYWDDEVAFFRPFYEEDERNFQETKDEKDATDTKNEADTKSAIDTKATKDDADTKHSKDTKDDPDAKIEKDAKDKDDKDDADAAAKEAADSKLQKDDADNKEWDDNKRIKDGEDKGPKDFKDQTIEKDSERNMKHQEFLSDGARHVDSIQPIGVGVAEPPEHVSARPDVALGRTFIRRAERPVVGASIVADPEDDA